MANAVLHMDNAPFTLTIFQSHGYQKGLQVRIHDKAHKEQGIVDGKKRQKREKQHSQLAGRKNSLERIMNKYGIERAETGINRKHMRH